jgi:carbon storage regulator
MLKLYRKAGEAIIIDNRIKVIVLKDKNNRTQLGIEAPKNVRILREEIVHLIYRKKQITIQRNLKELNKGRKPCNLDTFD